MRTLGSVVVSVDTAACISGAVLENRIRSEIQRAVNELDQAEDRLSQRSDPRVEVDAGGVHGALRFKLAIDGFADPNLDVDFTIGLRVRSGSAEPFFRSFAVDVDWPWWITVVTAGVSKIVEEFIDQKIEDSLRPRILDELKQQITDLVNELPGDLRLHTLNFAQDEIRLTACPGGDNTPFLVLSKAMGDDALG
jgi:hypothetical protein